MCEKWEQSVAFLKMHVNIKLKHHNLFGFVHTIDPETGNVILLVNSSAVFLIFVSAIRELSVVPQPTPKISMILPPLRDTSSVAIDRTIVIKFLHDRRIDAFVKCAEKDSPIVVFDGLAEILPPYGPNCVKCTNEVVFERIRSLLGQISKP